MNSGQLNIDIYHVVVYQISRQTSYISTSINLNLKMDDTNCNSGAGVFLLNSCNMLVSRRKPLFSSKNVAADCAQLCCNRYHCYTNDIIMSFEAHTYTSSYI